MRSRALIGVFFLIAGAACGFSEDSSTNEIVKKIVKRATENEKQAAQYGFNAGMAIKWLQADGSLKKMELREYRTVWESNSPRLELYQVNQAPLTEAEREKEEKNRQELRQAVSKGTSESHSSSMRIPVTWEEFCAKYDFTRNPDDTSAAYVLSFIPAKRKLQERSRIEKVLNSMSGKMWVDDQFRIIRLSGSLAEDVKFGFGIVKVDRMEMDYQQQMYGNVALPAVLKLRLHLKAFVFKNEEREITTRFSDFHRDSDSLMAESRQAAVREARK